MKKAIIIFSRIPVAGHTKTRMEIMLSKDECAVLHKAMLKDIVSNLKYENAHLFIYFTPDKGKDILISLLGEDLVYRSQKGEDLGERMFNAIREILEEGYDKCILIGSDTPDIDRYLSEKAFKILDEKDVVLGPTEDEGYCLVGMKTPERAMFENKAYGSGKVLEEAIKALMEKGRTVGLTEKKNDLDEPGDLIKFYEEKKSQAKKEDFNAKETFNFIGKVIDKYI